MMTTQEAVNKARYGHRDWLSWNDAGGNQRIELKTVASLEKAIADTNGNFTLIAANSGNFHRITKGIAQIMLNNAKRGIF